MPNRILRDNILSSEPVASLKWDEEVFYRRLMSIADDYGRHESSPQLLRAKCYPLQTDHVRVADITRWMAACQKAGLILGYAKDGKAYLEICKFGQQLRSASKCPAPPAIDISCDQLLAVAHLGVSVSVGVSEGVGVDAHPPLPKRRKPAKTLLADDFAVSDAVKAWAESKGITRLDDHFESFKAKAKAKAYEYADWDAALMNAIRDDWAKLGSSSATTKPRRKQLGEGSSTNYGDPA